MQAPHSTLKPTPLFLVLILTVLFSTIAGPAAAGYTIWFNDRSVSGPDMIDVYAINGTHIGEYNTSSTFEINESVIIHLSPDRSRDYISEPMTLVDDLSVFAADNLVAIVILCLIIGFLVVRR